MITDGKSNDPVLTIGEAANNWKNKGAKIYALGFGDKVDTEGMRKVACCIACTVCCTCCTVLVLWLEWMNF